jgi:hypothetical protein
MTRKWSSEVGECPGIHGVQYLADRRLIFNEKPMNSSAGVCWAAKDFGNVSAGDVASAPLMGSAFYSVRRVVMGSVAAALRAGM